MMQSNKTMIIQLITSRNNSKICVENTDEGQVLKEVTTNTKTEIWEVIRATDEDVAEVDLKKQLAGKATRATITSKIDSTNLLQQHRMEVNNIECKTSKECSKTIW